MLATGFLSGKRECLGRFMPTLVGGDTVEDSTLEAPSYRDGPERFEAGFRSGRPHVGGSEARSVSARAT